VANRRKFLQQLTATAGAFSAAVCLINWLQKTLKMQQGRLKDFQHSNLQVMKIIGTVIQQAYTVNPNII
jgi:hypothetical protein